MNRSLTQTEQEIVNHVVIRLKPRGDHLITENVKIIFRKVEQEMMAWFLRNGEGLQKMAEEQDNPELWLQAVAILQAKKICDNLYEEVFHSLEPSDQSLIENAFSNFEEKKSEKNEENLN